MFAQRTEATETDPRQPQAGSKCQQRTRSRAYFLLWYELPARHTNQAQARFEKKRKLQSVGQTCPLVGRANPVVGRVFNPSRNPGFSTRITPIAKHLPSADTSFDEPAVALRRPAPQPGGKKPEALLPPAGAKQIGKGKNGPAKFPFAAGGNRTQYWFCIRHASFAILYSTRQRRGPAKDRGVKAPFLKRGSEKTERDDAGEALAAMLSRLGGMLSR